MSSKLKNQTPQNEKPTLPLPASGRLLQCPRGWGDAGRPARAIRSYSSPFVLRGIRYCPYRVTVELAALVPRYRPRLAPMVRRCGVLAHEVDDVLQDTAIALLKSGVQPGKASAFSLIYQKAKWVAQSHVRRSKRSVEPIDQPIPPNALVGIALSETMAKVNRLPLHQRTALLSKAEGFKTREIAADMDWPKHTVFSWIQEARRTLKRNRKP